MQERLVAGLPSEHVEHASTCEFVGYVLLAHTAWGATNSCPGDLNDDGRSRSARSSPRCGALLPGGTALRGQRRRHDHGQPTGLTWEKLSGDGGTIHDVDRHFDWEEAFTVKIVELKRRRWLHRTHELPAPDGERVAKPRGLRRVGPGGERGVQCELCSGLDRARLQVHAVGLLLWSTKSHGDAERVWCVGFGDG
jgi:hypothetical protein